MYNGFWFFLNGWLKFVFRLRENGFSDDEEVECVYDKGLKCSNSDLCGKYVIIGREKNN